MNKKQELGIYIHIPFCAKKCYYCDFVSYPNMKEKQKEYVEALKKEIKSYDLQNYNITTIYIGGGTPSYIESKYIVDVLEYIKSKLNANDTKFENILTQDLQYIVLVYNKPPIFGRWYEKP